MSAGLPQKPRVAIVHDWLDTWRGGENVLAEVLALFPHADLYALIDLLPDTLRPRILGKRARTSFLQHLPGVRRHFRRYLPLFPRAIEALDLRAYDVVLSISHAVAKGVRTRAGQMHVCYCLTPMRYAWDLQEDYLRQVGLARGLAGWGVRRMLSRLRAWDRETSGRVHHFVGISSYIADRIRRCYGRDATVIYPPVTLPTQTRTVRGDAYVTVSQLVPYKRVDLIVEAFRDLPDRELVVVGEGPERTRIEAVAGANVRLTGRVSDGERDQILARARAFVFAAEEDFGIAPLEAQAMGVPVVALARGAAIETIRGLDAPEPTGVFFADQDARAIAQAIRTFEAHESAISPEACRRNAERFSPERFRRELEDLVQTRWAQFAAQASS